MGNCQAIGYSGAEGLNNRIGHFPILGFGYPVPHSARNSGYRDMGGVPKPINTRSRSGHATKLLLTVSA